MALNPIAKEEKTVRRFLVYQQRESKAALFD